MRLCVLRFEGFYHADIDPLTLGKFFPFGVLHAREDVIPVDRLIDGFALRFPVNLLYNAGGGFVVIINELDRKSVV